MKRGGGKRKGSAFERLVAHDLSMWITRKKDPRQLIRSVLSGGWQGTTGKEGWRQVGDLAPNGPIGERFRRRYAVECKHHRQINLLGLWVPPSKKADVLFNWWAKLKKDAAAAGVEPMIIFRANGFPIMVGHSMKHNLSGSKRRADFYGSDLRIVPFADLLASDPDPFIAEGA